MASAPGHCRLPASPAHGCVEHSPPIERIVESGELANDVVCEWLLQKAELLVTNNSLAEARPLLERALALGEASAGYHLAVLHMKIAAAAGVAEAVQVVNDWSANEVSSESRPCSFARRIAWLYRPACEK